MLRRASGKDPDYSARIKGELWANSPRIASIEYSTVERQVAVF